MSRKDPGVVTLEIKIDLRAWNRAIQGMMKAAERMASVLSGLGRKRLTPVRYLQDQHGLGNRAGDGAWLSDLCSAWVHDTCPLPGHCDCRCHR